MIPSLAALPSSPPDALFGAQGFHQNPQAEGSGQGGISAEWLSNDGSEPGFQVNCGLRIQGGSSRSPDTPKHSLSLRFRSGYGAGKLRYPLFKDAPQGESALDAFDFIQLRSGYNHAWMHRHYYQCDVAQYNRDTWANDLALSMGQPAAHGRWMHLYLNGIYWGIYYAHERPDADYMAAYFGGTSADYDTLNSGTALTGDKAAWNAMVAIANSGVGDPAVYAQISDYLNVENLIDYMLLNIYVGNRDWDGHNWRAGRKREPGAGYLFFPWDSEFSISANNPGVINSPAGIAGALGTDVTNKNNANGPTGLHQDLRASAEYRIHFADRVRKHCFGDGPLAPANAAAIWKVRSDVMDEAIVAESARWGDFRRDVSSGSWSPGDFALYTKNDHYLPIQNYLFATYFPQRTDIVLAQLRADSLYPSIDAPEFSQSGGVVAPGYGLEITAPSGDTIYYTLDGSDPREVGGAVSAGASTYGAAIPLADSGTVKARALTGGGEWSALTEAAFIVGVPASPANLALSEIHYHPLPPSVAESDAGFTDQDQFEFLEVVNFSSGEIDLTGVRFSAGIDFAFPVNARLAAGARALIVRDAAAFAMRYPAAPAPIGEFANGTGLDNGGERITLLAADGSVIADISYGDAPPWPEASDGDGPSLTLMLPGQSDAALAESWRPSLAAGGSPGENDALIFTGGSLADYAIVAGSPRVSAAPSGGGYVFEVTVRLGADEALVWAQASGDLIGWDLGGVALVGQTPNGDGTVTLAYSLPPEARFARAAVSPR
ncbi:MAG: CotH kinase family protein [Verrucomicrobiales bacterium]